MSFSASTLGAFTKWWIGELRSVFAPAAEARSARPRCIVLTPDAGRIRIDHEDSRGLRPLADAETCEPIPIGSLATALSMLRPSERKLPLVVRFPVEMVRTRSLDLPADARRDFPRLLALELARSSPLRTTDLLHAYEVNGPGSSPGMLSVRHFLVKRRPLEIVQEKVAAGGLRISAVECWNDSRATALPLEFHPVGVEPPRPPARRLEIALAAAILTLGIATTGVAWLRKEQGRALAVDTVASLEPSALEGRRALGRARDAVAEAERIRLVFDGRVAVLAAMEEVTRLVPDGAWVDELRIEGDTIELAGLARSGSDLLTVFQSSAMLHDAQFTAPLRFEPSEERERFRLRARLHPILQPANVTQEASR